MEKEKRTWDKSLWPEEVAILKDIIAKTGLKETTKWGGPVYTYNGKNVLGVGGFKNFFTIWFFKGIFLKDEAGKLVNANEGNTKALRQWRFTSKQEIDEKLILQYIYEAIETEKAGKEIKPEKKPLIIPALLQQALDADERLAEAFNNFSTYKQKEFSEYVGGAKREKTKRARLEKIMPMIKSGKGLNDRYR